MREGTQWESCKIWSAEFARRAEDADLAVAAKLGAALVEAAAAEARAELEAPKQ